MESKQALDEAMDEAMEQKSDMRLVGYGCLIFLAVLFVAALFATVVSIINRAKVKEVAAYSICERCGLLLDGTNVHAACVEEGAYASQ